jgi:hypothetical protein
MKSIDILSQVYKSFNMFSYDFKQKEITPNLNIYYALDNDVFTLALMPYDQNIKYADLFEDYQGVEHTFLAQQAKQLAYALRYMVERGSIVILPSHAMEYKQTIFHLFKSIEDLKYKTTNNEIIEKEHQSIIGKLNNIEDDKLIEFLKKDAPELLNILEDFNKITFSTEQLQIIMGKSKKIDDILEDKIHIDDSLPQEIVYYFEKYEDKRNRKKRENIINDINALKTVVAYNKKNTNKKLVLLTGDKGIAKTYKKYDEDYDINDIYAVRHPKYLIPFITKYNSLYSEQNKETLKKIDNLFEEFFNDFEPDKIETVKENAKKVIRSLKNILNLRDIEEFSMNDIDSPESKYNISQLKDKNFLDKLQQSIIEERERLLGSISLTPALTELLRAHSDFSRQKIHHRFPFVIEAEDYVQQSQIDDFTIKTFKTKNIINEIVNLDQFFNIDYIQLICSVVMNFIDKKDVALKYIEYTRKELSSEDSHILNESYLLEVFIRRTSSINDDDISEILSILDNKLVNPSRMQLLRKDIGRCSLLITKQYMDYFNDKKISKNELLGLNKSLEDLLNEYNNVFEFESLLKERAKVQIYMNILSLYLFETIFLQHKVHIKRKEFFKENREVYKSLRINMIDGENNRFIPYRNIMIDFLLFIVLADKEEGFILNLQKNALKNSIKSQISNKYIYIMDYERKRFEELLSYIEDTI